MQDIIDTARIFQYHRYMISMHTNTDHRALGWQLQADQQKRFEVLAGIADLNGCSILDAGCGHSDFLPLLKTRYPDIRYYGIEQMPEFLELAIERHGDTPESFFYLGDFVRSGLPVTDYVLVSGSLNYQNGDPDFLYKAIQHIFDYSRLGIGFNLLSAVSEGSMLAAYSPKDVLKFCQSLSKRVTLLDDYLADDFTIFIYKDDGQY